MEHRKGYRGIELMKDALIVLLTISALWLAAQTPLAAPMWGLLREERGQAAPGQSQDVNQGMGALPMAMVANLPAGANLPGELSLPEGTEGIRCGLLYDQAACQELFQQVAGPLVEALSSAGEPEPVSRSRWEIGRAHV